MPDGVSSSGSAPRPVDPPRSGRGEEASEQQQEESEETQRSREQQRDQQQREQQVESPDRGSNLDRRA